MSFNNLNLKRAIGAEGAPVSALGPVTGCDLGDIGCLTRPFERDPFYRLRPAFSPEAARLSLELANMTYTLELDPWIAAGWYDLSIQIDNTLQSGLVVGQAASGETMRAAVSAYKMHRAKVALRERNPIAQVMSALRQRAGSDTIKAVVMMHKRPEGGYLLAIGFMGTGKRFYDWFSNFRFTTEEGFHKGFLQLCAYFEKSEDAIFFPETAAELGLERLTLGDVLKELTSANSRFRLWMAGHSQGGAVMQVFTHRLIRDGGALPQNIVGYGFASPTVVTGQTVFDPAAYPLYHIINSDDMVPRMGAVMHLGLCLRYQSNQQQRDATYFWSDLPAASAAREALFPYMLQMVDTPSILMHGTAFLQCLVDGRGEEWLNSLMSRWWSVKPIDFLMTRAGDAAQGWTDRLVKHTRDGYAAVTGHDMDELELSLIRDNMQPMALEHPTRRLLTALLEYCASPHSITRNEYQNDGAYAYLIKNGLGSLRPFIWVRQPNGTCVRSFAEYGESAADTSAPQTLAVRRKPAQRRTTATGKQRVSVSAKRDTRGGTRRDGLKTGA